MSMKKRAIGHRMIPVRYLNKEGRINGSGFAHGWTETRNQGDTGEGSVRLSKKDGVYLVSWIHRCEVLSSEPFTEIHPARLFFDAAGEGGLI